MSQHLTTMRPIPSERQIYYGSIMAKFGYAQMLLGFGLFLTDVLDLVLDQIRFVPMNTIYFSGILTGCVVFFSGAYAVGSARPLPAGRPPRNRIRNVLISLVFSAVSILLSTMLVPLSFMVSLSIATNKAHDFGVAHFALFLGALLIGVGQIVIASVSLYKLLPAQAGTTSEQNAAATVDVDAIVITPAQLSSSRNGIQQALAIYSV